MTSEENILYHTYVIDNPDNFEMPMLRREIYNFCFAHDYVAQFDKETVLLFPSHQLNPFNYGEERPFWSERKDDLMELWRKDNLI
jgi:hypothetical protein